MAVPARTAPPRATFGRHERLRGRDAFDALFKDGLALNDAPLRLVGRFTEHPDGTPLRAAFVVPKRSVRLASDRNRIRRQLREAFRLNKHGLNDRLRQAGLQVDWLFLWRSPKGPARGESPQRILRLAERWLDRNLPTKTPSA